ncbi:hypothetical protein TanjilG_22319 [Lupinus angustifolius]|uniref:Uncharacterized protein n=1 Tax=Lupinus angustifolius TaxID=3871 RepID=A0A1J7HZC1_LUPAN|nr:hypothetical protein TanjilG_22319 [Lupinus angustifolius]
MILEMQVYDKGTWLVSCKDVRKSFTNSSWYVPSGGSYQDLFDSNCNADMRDDISCTNGNSEDGVQTIDDPVTHQFC